MWMLHVQPMLALVLMLALGQAQTQLASLCGQRGCGYWASGAVHQGPHDWCRAGLLLGGVRACAHATHTRISICFQRGLGPLSSPCRSLVYCSTAALSALGLSSFGLHVLPLRTCNVELTCWVVRSLCPLGAICGCWLGWARVYEGGRCWPGSGVQCSVVGCLVLARCQPHSLEWLRPRWGGWVC